MAGALHSQSDTCNATTMHPREGRGHLPPGLGARSHLVPPQPSSPCRWCPWGGCPAPGSPAGSCWPSHSGSGWPGSHPVCSASCGQLGKSAGQHGEGASCKAGGHGHCRPLTVHSCALPQHTPGAPSVFREAVPVQGRGETCNEVPSLSLMSPALTQSSAVPGAWSPPAGRGAQPPPHLPAASR